MTAFVPAYLAALLGMLVLDAAWLGLVMPSVYAAALGHLLLPEPRWGAAALFYLLYPVGIVVFAVLPAWRDAPLKRVLMLGGLYGGMAYATYDLTNLATLTGWPVHIVVLDIAWGIFISAAAAMAGRLALRKLQKLPGA